MQSVKTVGSILGVMSVSLLGACAMPMEDTESEEAPATLSEALSPGNLVLSDFGLGQGWTAQDVRLLADFNGDGRKDILGINGTAAYVSYSTGSGFTGKQLLNHHLSSSNWSVDNPRMVGSVGPDNKADIIAFLPTGVAVSYSEQGWSHLDPDKVPGLGTVDGWTVANHPRMLGDINGDGKDDIVAFGYYGVTLSFSLPNVYGFTTPAVAVSEFGYGQGWRVNQHPRFLADVNGDGRKDVVGFKGDGVWLSLSTGSGLSTARRVLTNQFGYNAAAGGWREEYHPRFLADVNGDRRADIVGFANDGAWVSLSTGSGFSTPVKWIGEFGYSAGGWRVDMHPRFVTDVTGDGRADVVGIANDGVWVAASTGTRFSTPVKQVEGFGYNDGWRVGEHPRFIMDVSGDRRADFVGFGYYGVSLALL